MPTARRWKGLRPLGSPRSEADPPARPLPRPSLAVSPDIRLGGGPKTFYSVASTTDPSELFVTASAVRRVKGPPGSLDVGGALIRSGGIDVLVRRSAQS